MWYMELLDKKLVGLGPILDLYWVRLSHVI